MSCLSRIIGLSSIKSTALNISRFLSTQKVSSVSSSILPQITSTNNPWIWRINDQVKLPVVNNNKFDLPNGLRWVPPLIIDPTVHNKTMEEPPLQKNDIAKEAARLIVIRRKKMKKHKLRKLRKRMKFEWAKLRQRRELKKEKAFQAVLIQQCKEAEAFSAEDYVNERISKLNEIVIPKYWKGKRLPEFLIREKMGLPPKK